MLCPDLLVWEIVHVYIFDLLFAKFLLLKKNLSYLSICDLLKQIKSILQKYLHINQSSQISKIKNYR